MTFTTQSESVPEVDATRFAMGSPLIFIGEVRTSETNESTSGRPEASRWSSPSQRDQLLPSIGRARYGTGFEGSETYSSNAAPPDFGASRLSLRPEERYIGVA